jgi:hypothetical protein
MNIIYEDNVHMLEIEVIGKSDCLYSNYTFYIFIIIFEIYVFLYYNVG